MDASLFFCLSAVRWRESQKYNGKVRRGILHLQPSGARPVLTLLVAFLTACACFVANRGVIRLARLHTAVLFSPLVEETFKTALPLAAGTDVAVNHLLFGVAEAVYERSAGQGSGWGAAAACVAGHTFFGYLTAGVWSWSDTLLAGWLAGFLAHLAWNAAVMRLARGKGAS